MANILKGRRRAVPRINSRPPKDPNRNGTSLSPFRPLVRLKFQSDPGQTEMSAFSSYRLGHHRPVLWGVRGA